MYELILFIIDLNMPYQKEEFIFIQDKNNSFLERKKTRIPSKNDALGHYSKQF